MWSFLSQKMSVRDGRDASVGVKPEKFKEREKRPGNYYTYNTIISTALAVLFTLVDSGIDVYSI